LFVRHKSAQCGGQDAASARRAEAFGSILALC